MASVEEIIRADGVRYRGVPWDAARGKKGPTRSFIHFSDALAYAEGWEKDRDKVAEAFGVPTLRNKRRVLFADYAREYALRADGEKRTRASRQRIARVLGRRITVHVDEIDRKLIGEVVADMAHLAPGTRRNRISFLRKVLAEAVLDKLIDDNPCRDIEQPRRATLRSHTIPTEDQLGKIIEHMADWFEPAILLAHDSGLRESELAGLRWFRVDLTNRRVTVADVLEPDGTIRAYPKGKEHRVVPLSARTINALRREKLRQGAGDLDFVVRRPGHTLMTTSALAGYWRRSVATVPGLGERRPTVHDLRHACAHRLVRSGIDIRKLQAFMGHRKLDTTRIYMPDVTPDELTSALDAVAVPVSAPVVALAGA